jgi:hypothetical protein
MGVYSLGWRGAGQKYAPGDATTQSTQALKQRHTGLRGEGQPFTVAP